MIVLGLTGGMGSGKSTIARVFETFGIPVYSSDERAKQLYFLPQVKVHIETILGKEAYLNQTTLDKKHISGKIFSDANLLKQVNAIIHTAVKHDFEHFIGMHKDEKYIIKESALLIEANLLPSVDKLLLITSDLSLRKKRIALRDGLNEEEINKRISQQLPEEEKMKYADWIIENNEEQLIIPQVVKINGELLN